MSEYATIKVQRYRDPSGNPTCARDIMDGKCCTFLRFARMGTLPMCHLLDQPLFYPQIDSFSTPLEGCQVWDKPEGSVV